MNKYLIILLAIFFIGCKSKTETQEEKTAELLPIEWIQNATMYEVNLRHFSPEGNIAGFIPHLDRLKSLGVDVLWFMPIQPIGALNRKAKGDLFVQDIADLNERKKYLGSPYSISDYKAVNPDYGTVEDFKQLVAICHEKGFKVIIDWVGNHTSWDHPWVKAHPNWYTQINGKITDPLDGNGKSMGWTDVADLNYGDTSLWSEMTADMKFWVDECNIDGFRCDVAFEVPAPFWKAAVTEIRKSKEVFMLAEAESHKMEMYDGTFQAYYAWTVHHFMNELAKGKIDAKHFASELQRVDSIFGDKAFPMNFITNHDENSWNGTEFERMGNRWRSMAVMSFALKGMPLIYTGQEVGLKHRMKFFEKDSVNWGIDSALFFTAFYSELNRLKADADLMANAAMDVQVDGDVMRIKRGSHLFIFNFSDKPTPVIIPEGKKMLINHLWENDQLGNWGYLVLR